MKLLSNLALFTFVGSSITASLASNTARIRGKREGGSSSSLHRRTPDEGEARKKGKSKSSDDSSEEDGVFVNTCYSNKLQAGALGAATLAKLFLEIYDTDGCDPEAIGLVLGKFLAEDFTVSINGELQISGLENVKAAVLGDNVPPGSAIDLCLNHHTSFATLDVIDADPTDNSFTWVGNLISSPLAGGLPGREITFVLDEYCNAMLSATNDSPFKPLPTQQ